MLAIQKKYINYNYSRRSSKPKYIVIHDTGNPGAGANNHYIYFNGGNRGASADFFVDSNNIIQTVNTDVNYSWAVGDGKGVYGITNANSCSIEMCLEKDGTPSEATIQNTIELTKYLMSYYGISIEHVKRHYDASHKSCPNSFMANNWAKWHEFKSKVSGTQTETKVENVVVATSPATETKSNVQKAKEYVGDRCRELQEKLIVLGYNCGGYGVDSKFGQGTYDSLIQFQKDNPPLAVDGLAGIRTFAKLDELIAKKSSNSGDDWVRRLQQECNNQGFSNQKVDSIAGVNTLNGCPTLRQGASGNITKLLQEKLVSLGYSTNGIDGIYGSGTANAVKSYQSSKGLSQDGVCGQATWRKLLGL